MMKESFWFRGPVKIAAAARGLSTQKQIAQFVGITQPTVGRFLKLGKCSEATARLLASAFDLDFEKMRDTTKLMKQARLFEAEEQEIRRGVRF